MPVHEPPYDFFVSYARRDNESGWITSFVEALVAEHQRFVEGGPGGIPRRALKPYFDQHAIQTGADWQLHIAHGIGHSRLFLAFLSPGFFASEWCRKEWRAWLDAEIAQHILTAGVRPIYIVEVPGFTGAGQLSDQDFARSVAELSGLPAPERGRLLAETPPLVKHLRRRQHTHNQPFCDVHAFYDAGLDALRRTDLRRVLDELAHDLDHHAELLALADASLSTVPAYNRNFTGRLDELLTLRERLVRDDRTGVIYGVHGLGGIGKTELAFTYAHAYASAYPGGRFLVRCEGKSLLRDAVLGQGDLTALFPEIGEEARKQPDDYYAAVLACLRQRLGALGHVLLVLDNVSDLNLLEPGQTDTITALGPKLHLLATTRLAPATAGKGNWLSLDRLPDGDALDLLEKHRPFPDAAERDAAQRIVRRLGGFTLAVELVAVWLAKHGEVTCAGFLERLGIEDIETLDVLAEERDVQLRRHNDERRLGAVLDPTLAALAPEDRRVMEYAALLPPDHVALPWLRALVAGDLPEVIRAPRPGHADPWLALLDRLVGLALLLRPGAGHGESRLLRVHRLIQDRMRLRMVPAELAARQQAVDALARERDAALGNTTRWEDARWEVDPLEALAWRWAEPAPAASSLLPAHPQASWLLGQVALHRYVLAQWSLGEPLMRRALEIDEHSFGPGHARVAAQLNNLAKLLEATNRVGEAEPLLRRALEIDERCFGPGHPSVAIGLGNLATVLYTTNRLGEAEPLMRRALEINERCFGPDHPDVANALDNLAQLFQATNRLDEAEPLMRRALGIGERSFGPGHPKLATSLNNLAQLLQATNRLSEAETLIRRALEIDERSFGPHHPRVTIRIVNLAQLLQATNRLSEAEPLMRRALEADERSFGPDHPRVAVQLSTLAALFLATNRHGEAEPLLQRALEIDQRSFGPDHPEVATDLSNLAQLLSDTNRLGEAEPLMRRALEVGERSLGPGHPKVAIRLNNLAQLLKVTNRLGEAEPLMRRALEIDELSLGPYHPTVAIRLNNLAQLLKATNRLDEAEPLTRRALEIAEQSFGPEHPDVAIPLGNLAALLLATGRTHEAEPLMRRALEIGERSFGPGHPQVATSLNNLAQLLQATNRLSEAEPLMRLVLEADERSLGPEHPSVAIRLTNLASLLHSTNRMGEAEPLMRRALEIDERSFGPGHPEVATDLSNLATVLLATNRLDEAERLFRRAVQIRVAFARDTGHPHPHLQLAVDNYVAALEALQRSPEQILATIGEIAPQSKIAPVQVRGMALDLYERGDYAGAERLLGQLLDADFEPAGTRQHLARLCLLTDRIVEAREHVAAGWVARAGARVYVVARLLWFRIALAKLDTAEPAANRRDGDPLLGQMKELLQDADAFMEWAMDPVLERLATPMRAADAGRQDWELLRALVATMGDREKLGGLDDFPAWREAAAQPLS